MLNERWFTGKLRLRWPHGQNNRGNQSDRVKGELSPGRGPGCRWPLPQLPIMSWLEASRCPRPEEVKIQG